MDLFTQLLKTTEIVLRLWEHKEKRRYFEEFRSLQRRLKGEHAKPTHLKDLSIIDHTEFELFLLTRRVSEAASTPARPDSDS